MAAKNAIAIDFIIQDGKDGLKKLILDADGLRKVMEENVKVADGFQKKVFNIAATATSIQSLSGAAQQLIGVLQGLTSESLSFSKAMKAANTMAGKDSAGFEQLKDEVADLAKSIPIARDELANGLYQVVSNGVPEDNWISFLETSARSAVGGIADINKVVGVTSTLIKNYGLEWDAAAEIQDKIQLTAKNGVTSFEQLAQALPRVTGNAATLGVSIDELMGTFATLTNISGNTAEVSTQLGAIFTALVKPSSEAAEMAAKMGMQFDAAAIKAAGGFRNFLNQLDASVRSYAQANGVLEQEVYGKLFGSAEAMRALIPLQGELADKFTANVANMVNSAGTMDAAFEEMSSHGEATTQMLKNKFAVFSDLIASVTSGIQPFLDFGAGLLATAANVGLLAATYKQLNIAATAATVKTKLANGVFKRIGMTIKKTALAMEMLAVSEGKASGAAVALKFALRGLLAVTGIGLAFVAITSVIEYFCSSTDKATESVEKFDDATDEYTQAAAAAKAQIDNDIRKLGDLIKANDDTTDAVKRLNDTYGDIFGTCSTAAEWYETLTKKSMAYAKQVGYEAQAKALSARLAEAAIKKEMAAERKASLERLGQHLKTGKTKGTKEQRDWVRGESKKAEKEYEEASKEEEAIQTQLETVGKLAKKTAEEVASEVRAANSELKINEMNWGQCEAAIKRNEAALESTTDPKRIAALREQNRQLAARQKALKVKDEKGNKKKIVANPKKKEELQTNIDLSSKKLTGEDTEEQRKLIKDIALWKKKLEAIELAEKATERPASLETLDDYDKELRYQAELRLHVPEEDLAEIDAEIESLQVKRAALESKGHKEIPVEKIETYRQLNAELSYYNDRLQAVTDIERVEIQKQINSLEELKEKWDDVLAEVDAPGDISTLNNLKELGKAIDYYRQKQAKATGDEVQDIQQTIDALERKSKALQRGVELPSMMREAEEINALTGREYKIKIRDIGFDALTAKIKELQKMLNDTENPVTEKQREEIEGLIGTYEQWRKESVITFDTFRSGYDSLKGIGSGVESVTNALEGNGNAWQTVTGIVDGFLQIYEGIKTVVGIINMLSVATMGKKRATDEETQSLVANTAASLTNTAAKSGESIAEATASGAKMPFPLNLVAIAAGVAAVVSALAIVGSFATGGIVGGNSPSGDKLLARVNSGEMILNREQQQRLFKALSGTAPMPFANGGIIKGPTLGFLGEYAGASNNPEVVAPLDRLRSLIRPADDSGGVVTFKIEGRTLVGIIEKENNVRKRR